MDSTAKTVTTVNLIFSGILWLLGLLVFIFNVCGLWAAWHIAGFGVIFYIPFPLASQIIALAYSFLDADAGRKCKIINSVSLAVSVAVTVFTVTVSAGWFW